MKTAAILIIAGIIGILLLIRLALWIATKVLWKLYDNQIEQTTEDTVLIPETYLVSGNIVLYMRPENDRGLILILQQSNGRKQKYFITRNWQKTEIYCKHHNHIRLRVENKAPVFDFQYAWQDP